MNVIKTNNLTKYYGKSRGIVDVSLEIAEGDIFGFIGPNGAGKSTTIRTLLNFIFPTSGSATVLGMDIITDAAKIKREIGYLPAGVNYYDDMKAADLLRYSARFYGKDCDRRIKELGELFELELDRKIEDLSSGNKKKVAILQALIHAPRLLILDEPTGGLDPLMQARFFELLKKENDKGTTIFFSSHILSEVQKICHKVAIIREGRILQVEEIDKLRENKYKKIRIDFHRDNMAEELTIDGMSNVSVKDRQVSFLYNGKIDALLEKISGTSIDNLWIEEPSLEEIFMHYYEGGEE